MPVYRPAITSMVLKNVPSTPVYLVYDIGTCAGTMCQY